MAFEYAIVLTGSIGTGKSSTAGLLSSFGLDIIDADKVAHQILNVHAQEVADMFGSELLVEGVIDRRALGSIVFADSARRKALEDLLHPLIYDEIEQRSLVLDEKKKPYLIDIPLFFEGGRYPIKKSIVVYAASVQQRERLMARNGYTQEEAQSRIDAQISVEEKRKKATYVIDNSGTLTQLKEECARVAKEIIDDSD